MAINPPNAGIFQQTLTQIVVSLRNDFQQIVNLNQYITAQGGVAFLENTIGLTPTDAATVVSTFGNLAALASIYAGGTPGAPLNYQANTELLWGGQ